MKKKFSVRMDEDLLEKIKIALPGISLASILDNALNDYFKKIQTKDFFKGNDLFQFFNSKFKLHESILNEKADLISLVNLKTMRAFSKVVLSSEQQKRFEIELKNEGITLNV